jgi:large subunit ribosomal protein L28
MVKCRAFSKMPCSGKRGATDTEYTWNYSKKGCCKKMAKCANCGKSTTFGHNRSFSQRATNRSFKPNLQKTLVMEKGRVVHKVLCAKCIKTLSKTAV